MLLLLLQHEQTKKRGKKTAKKQSLTKCPLISQHLKNETRGNVGREEKRSNLPKQFPCHHFVQMTQTKTAQMVKCCFFFPPLLSLLAPWQNTSKREALLPHNLVRVSPPSPSLSQQSPSVRTRSWTKRFQVIYKSRDPLDSLTWKKCQLCVFEAEKKHKEIL